VREDVEEAARQAAKKSEAAAVTCEAFCGLMDAAIAAAPRPRAYLVRSASPRPVAADTFAPTIDERSKQIAAKLRPKVRLLSLLPPLACA
jgi:hypothetical protein